MSFLISNGLSECGCKKLFYLPRRKKGVIAIEKKLYFTADDVAGLLRISKSRAYKIIRQYNAELESKGYLTLAGKVARKYFAKKWYGYENETSKEE